jgi:hypothetical protein
MADPTLVLDRATDTQVLWRLAKQHRQQCRFSGAVAPNQANLLAVAHREGNWLENTACTNLYSQIPNYEHLATQ